MKRLVIFDLDGTLLNTIEDLANSTNYALKQNGFPTHEISEYNYFVGNGINKLFERALPEGAKSEDNILRIREIFLQHYDTHNVDYSAPYPEIEDLLLQLQQKGVMLAVASNKYQSATEKLVAHYFPQIHFVQVWGQREGIPTKPNPSIVNSILEFTEISKVDTLYVGDSGVDMQTALNSGVDSCGVTWGFRPLAELMEFEPTHVVNNPKEILSII